MKLQAKESALLKACFGLSVAACLLAWITGAGQSGVLATAYLAMTATCGLWAYERKRPAGTERAPADLALSPTPCVEARDTAPLLRVRAQWAPQPAPRRALTRSVAGLGLATLLMISALAPVARPISGSLVLGAMTLGSVAAWGRLSEKDEEDLELALPASLRCPLCLESFSDAERATPCEGCLTIYHSECLEEWNQCAVLGCDTTARFGSPARVRLAPGRRVSA